MEESDPDYIAPSESEEDREFSADSDVEESDDELLENEERDLNPLPRCHVHSKIGKWDASCVDKDESALKMWDETPEEIDIGVCFKSQSETKHAVKLWNIHHKREYRVVASSPTTWAVWCRTLDVPSEDGDPSCVWKMRESLKDHDLHQIDRIVSVISDRNAGLLSAMSQMDEWYDLGDGHYFIASATFVAILCSDIRAERVGAFEEELIHALPEGSSIEQFQQRARTLILWECKYTYENVPRSSVPPLRDQLTGSRIGDGEVLNNILICSEQFRDKSREKELLDSELEEHLNDIVNQVHTALTLGTNDEGKKAKLWPREKIGGGRKRKLVIPPRSSQQQNQGEGSVFAGAKYGRRKVEKARGRIMHKTAQGWFSGGPTNDLQKAPPSLLADWNAYAASRDIEESAESSSSTLGFDLESAVRTANDKVSGTFNVVSKGVRDLPGSFQSATSSVPSGKSLMYFALLLASGVFFIIIAFSIFLPVMVIAPQKFAICFTMGCGFIIGSFFALKGPKNQLAHMMSKERLPFTVGFLVSTVGTMYVSMMLHSYILSVFFSLLQVIALSYYAISYFPGGSAGLKFLSSTITSSILNCFGR
ncbi:OLC1v1024422C1 [Oldenlandia corymbosa var. corymbosa]|uniref:Vesicle transport protein n=1 Tax=Oldenlandia corymbosa var. corymbosa TaxID=529605 RepID=A0AAV1C4S0_OLDCO|nr:OLC1v1024422C1 [Oldenlandia corymbosa var. corymbosa]